MAALADHDGGEVEEEEDEERADIELKVEVEGYAGAISTPRSPVPMSSG